MHELGIAIEIYRSSRLAVKEHGPGRLGVVRVAVGERSALEPELLVSAWDVLTAGGPDQGARLEIEWRPVHQRCLACGEDKPRAPGSWLRLCPDCQSPLEVDGGDELDLLQVEFETEVAP